MKKIIFVFLLALAALYFMQPTWFDFTAKPGTFRGDGSERIVVFTTSKCGGACADAVAWLTASGQVFEELKLDSNEDNKKLFQQLGGSNTVPYLASGYQRIEGFYPGDYLSMLVVARGLTILDETMRAVYAQHFDATGNPLLVMYGTTWCVDCAAMREYCNDHDVQYINLDVELDEVAKMRYELLGGRSFPTVFYGARRMTGFSQQSLTHLMEK
jgi:glutaredoxin